MAFNIKSLLEKTDKKYKFSVHAVVITLYIYLASMVFWNYSFYWRIVLGLALLVVSTYLIHYPNVLYTKKRFLNFLMTLVLQSFLFGSALLALKYYPNLSLLFKLTMLAGIGVLFYIISIVDNIFLVVSQREETIPLYRAAVPWSQILLVIVAIPLFAGIFKIPTYSYIQIGLISLLTVVLNFYQFWSYRHEENLVGVGVGGRWFFALLSGFFVLATGIATSFLPFESFLRGLTTAAALMFGLFYTSSYMRNTLSQRLLLQYNAIILAFILLGLMF
jgi:hypothetical protein